MRFTHEQQCDRVSRDDATAFFLISAFYAEQKRNSHAIDEARSELETAQSAVDAALRACGFMTKDLALLIGPDQKWLSTTGFLDKVGDNLKKAMAALPLPHCSAKLIAGKELADDLSSKMPP